MMRLSTKRSGFTLVEVIAAIVIGAVLLAAVYSTLEIMLKSIRIGKEAVQSLQVIRGTAIRLQTYKRLTDRVKCRRLDSNARAAERWRQRSGKPVSTPQTGRA